MEASTWRTLLTLGTAVAVTAGIAYAFLNSDSTTTSGGTKKKVSDTEKRKLGRSKGSTKSGSRTTVISDNEDDEIDASKLRGYKQTKTGQTTTYFNRELSEKDKALLGDSTPKRIDVGSPIASCGPTRISSSVSSPSSTSAWNTAGTWEERDVTQWATSRLTELLSSISFSEGTNEIHVTSVSSVTGDASIASARGKRKNIYDFSVELNWKLLCAGTILATGSTSVGDITAAGEHEVVSRVNGQAEMSSSLKTTLQQLVLVKNSKLRQRLDGTLQLFSTEFESKTL